MLTPINIRCIDDITIKETKSGSLKIYDSQALFGIPGAKKNL